MSDASDMPCAALAEAVERCRLPSASFRHRQHVQLGWYYLDTRPLLDAVLQFGRVVARFAEHHGAHGKYDEPLTMAYMLLIEERRQLAPEADFSTFASLNADLLADGQEVLRRRLGRTEQSTRAALPERNGPAA